MKAAIAIAVVAVAAAGCGKRGNEAGAPLELAAARLVIDQADGQSHVLALAPDGAVTFDNQPVVKLTRDGQIAAPDGRLMARLDRDYRLFAHGVETNVTVLPSGVFQMNGVDELLIAEDGKVSGPLLETMDHPRVNVEDARVAYEGPPGARQALLVGFAAFVTGLTTVPDPR